MISRGDAEPRMPVHQACAASGDGDVREERNGKPGSHGAAADGGDHGFRAIHQVVDEIARLLPYAHQRRVVGDHLLDERKVSTRAEVRTGAAHQHRTHCRVGIDAAPNLRKIAVQRRAGGVQARLVGNDHLENSRQRRIELQCRMGGTVGSKGNGSDARHGC
jgi:hypothetical protein